MRTGKSNREDEEYEEDEFDSKKEGPSSASAANNSNNSNTKGDAKNNDKANALRSKHSVTEQRRRSKINERFQILRDLIPHSDQKRDTASFLLEVIEYVQYLQERVQKYEGSYQSWSGEPTKLMPWRNSHWRIQNFVGYPETTKNGSVPGSTFPGKFDENNNTISPALLKGSQDLVESDPCRVTTQQAEIQNKGVPPLSLPLQANIPVPDGIPAQPQHRPINDAQSSEGHLTADTLNQQDEMTIEGGTISISSAYSEGLLTTLTQALQNAGVDLSQANISVQIDLAKRANGLSTSGLDPENTHSSSQARAHPRDIGSGQDSDHATKRLKT